MADDKEHRSYTETRDYSNKAVQKRSGSRYGGGNWEPSLKTKAEYRKDMSDLAYSKDYYEKHKDFPGDPTPKRYYRSFDRGAARQARKSSRR
jgi:hypothetical protein